MVATSRPNARLLLKKAGCRAFLITNTVNIRYLTGMNLSVGFLLVTEKGYFLFVDSRYLEAAKKIRGRGLTVCPLDTIDTFLARCRTIGIESEHVSVARMNRWKTKYKNKKFVHTSDVVEYFRRSKDAGELRLINRACRITRSVLARVPLLLKPGISERELAWQLEVESRKRGASGMAFESIVGFGENTSRPHHHPTDRRLKKGDIVQIDMGAKYGDYCSDFSRVYFTSKPTLDQAKAMKALKQASAEAKKILKIGVTNRALDLRAREVLSSLGYDKEFSHALGHGLGLDIHEGVTLSSKAPSQKLLKNEVITIEPGLYFEGKWGMRIEETIVVS